MKYKHPENRDKPYVDWRHPENRMEGFMRWLKWRMTWNDLDHYLINNSYAQGMTQEQKIWYSLIFGMTYQSEMAWVIFSSFPDFWSINLDDLAKWNVGNLERQKYAKDTKYNKGRIVEQVKSLQEHIGPTGSLQKYFENLLVEDEQKSFENVFNQIMQFHKYGRMTAWITCQTLFETANLAIRPNSIMATEPSNWSVRSGLMYLYNQDDKIEALGKVKFSSNELKWIEKTEQQLYNDCCEYLGSEFEHIWSNYLLESHLCQYKKLMLGGDYAGHSSGDHVSRYLWLKERWPELNWQPFTDAIKSHHPLVRGCRESKALRTFCVKTGQLINMHEDFPDLPNMFLETGIDPAWLKDQSLDSLIQARINNYAKIGNSLENFL